MSLEADQPHNRRPPGARRSLAFNRATPAGVTVLQVNSVWSPRWNPQKTSPKSALVCGTPFRHEFNRQQPTHLRHQSFQIKSLPPFPLIRCSACLHYCTVLYFSFHYFAEPFRHVDKVQCCTLFLPHPFFGLYSMEYVDADPVRPAWREARAPHWLSAASSGSKRGTSIFLDHFSARSAAPRTRERDQIITFLLYYSTSPTVLCFMFMSKVFPFKLLPHSACQALLTSIICIIYILRTSTTLLLLLYDYYSLGSESGVGGKNVRPSARPCCARRAS